MTFKFFKYQTNYIYHGGAFEAYNKSRQIGFTEAIGAKSVYRAGGYGINQLIGSSSQRQSNNAMSYVEKYLDLMLGSCEGMKVIKDTQTEKILNNGAKIFCLPSKPETIRGFNGDVRIDEYALHKDDGKIYEALLPSIVTNTNYQISIGSTPLGQSNMFYEIMTDEIRYPDFLRKTIDCYEAIRQGCKMDIDKIKRNFDEESFRQEFLCEFIDELTAYFTYDLLKKCIAEYETETLKTGENFIGIDIGRTKDRTAIAVVNDDGSKIRLKALTVLHNVDFDTQFETAAGMINTYDAAGILVDMGLIGRQLAESLEKTFMKCHGVQMTNMFKNECVTNSKKLMEQGEFLMYEDRDLITEWHKIKKTITPSNQVNFDSKRDKKGHADSAWAVMLANLAAVKKTEYNISWIEV